MGKKKKTEHPPRLCNFLLLAKFDDGVVRQVITNKDQQLIIASALMSTSDTGQLTVTETPVPIDWDSPIKLIP